MANIRATSLPPRLAVAGSNSSSSLLQWTAQSQRPIQKVTRIHSIYYPPARRRPLTTTTRLQKQKIVETEPTGPRRPRVYITKDAVGKEFVLDEDIPTREVAVKNFETGKLEPPQLLISLLSTIDRDVNVVRALATPGNGPAIVEITPRASLVDRLKNKEITAIENARAARAKKPKQIEVNWAMSINDLQLKLRQLRDFVDKGKRVEILLASKKRQRKATPEEAENVVSEIRKTIAEIEGCRETSPMEGKVGGQALMVVEKQA